MAKLFVSITSLLLLRITFAFNNAFILNSRCAERSYNCVNAIETRKLLVVTAIEAGSATTPDQPTDEHADAFRAYMAKSHEDKLRAVKNVEEKKDTEIKLLKKQIKEMESGSDVNTGSSVLELSAKVTAYQTFISQYILQTQEEKILAVKAAEEAIFKKYEDKLSALMLNAVDSKSITIAETSSVSTAPVNSNEPVPTEVIAADHGLRADGGVDGPSLADRVSQGAHAQTANGQREPDELLKETSALTLTPNPNVDPRAKVYLERNKFVSDAAKAGAHNRWGPMEEKVATDYVSLSLTSATETVTPTVTAATTMTVDPKVEDADHGLRADGGVGGPSLADRVNLGAQLLALR